MNKFFRKRILFPIIGALALVFSLVWALMLAPKTYAATEQLLYQLTLSDILANTNNLGSTTSQGSKGVWFWKGIKSLGSNSLEFQGNGESIFFWFGIDENSTDERLNRVTKLEWSFTASRAGGVMILCGDYSNVKQSIKNGENNISLSGFVSKYNYFKFDIDGGTYTPSTLTAFDIKLYYTPGAAATITKGTGIESVFLSNSNSATEGSNSGTSFDDGSTVYGYAELKSGYKAPTGWTYIANTGFGENTPGAIYRVGSKTINGAAVDFGTVNATPKTKTVSLNSNGGVGSGTINLTYDEANQAPNTGFSRELFSFNGWNSKADGSGYNYSTELSKWDVNEIILDNLDTLYAKWKINASGVETLIGNIGTVEFTSESKGKIKEARDGYESLSSEEKVQVSNYQTLLDAEETFNALFEELAEAQIGNIKYAFLPEAFEALSAGDTITLRHNVDLSNENIEITKNLTVDLNGHILKTTMEDGSHGTPTLLVSSNNTIFEIRNSKPATGGLNGLVSVDVSAVDSYIKVNDCRFVLSANNINNADILKVGPGYEAVNINTDGSADENGFVSIVKPLDIFDISNLDEDYIVPDGQVLTGRLDNPYKISIVDGATVTLKDIDIAGSDTEGSFAGITCLGDATLIIKGNNDLFGFKDGAGIFVPEGHTLTIDGDGILYSEGRDGAAGIGGNANTNSGNIIINGGDINADSGSNAAGIGGGYSLDNDLQSGNITINGGRINSTGRDGAGIGSAMGEACGDITINGGFVEARSSYSSSTGNCGSGIGSGKDGSCGDIKITDNIARVKATSRDDEKQIGGNYESLDIAATLSSELVDKTIHYYHTNTVIINGQVVNDSNLQGEGWSYDKDTNTLTLNGYEYVGPGKVYSNFVNHGDNFIAAISYDGEVEDDFIINLVGNNTIVLTQEDSPFAVCGIHNSGNESAKIKFIGKGSLSISVTGENTESYAIASGSTIIIDGPTIEANAGKATDSSAGVYLYDDGLDMISGSLYAHGEECSDDDLSYGIRTANENITIGENARALIASGYTNAIYGIVINDIEGIGWTDVDGTQGETKIEISQTGVDNIGDYKCISFIGITPEDVIGFINDIGNVEYTDACKEKIDTARGAYEFLKDEEKAQVTNYNILVEAENDYTNAGLVIGKINNIGVVEYTPEIKALIDDARTAYDALTQKAKNAVSNYNTLTQKEASYKTLDDNYKSSQVIELIKNIGTVTYSNESKNLIDNAKIEYDKLSTEAKALVTNYQTLTHDIEIYNHVDDVYKKIEAVKEVKYNDQTEADIEAARIAYDNLTDEEKTLVINYDKLTTDEKTYSGLRNDHKTLVGWMVALGIMGGIILGLVIAYFLLFFVFNKWTLANGNPIRVFVIGKKNGKVRLLNMTLMIIYREENEVFNTKEELVK